MAIVKVRQGYHSYTNSLWSAHLSQPSLGSESMKVLIPGLTARPTGGRGVRDLLSRLELPTGTKSLSFVPVGNEGLLAPIGTKRLLFCPDRCYPSWCYQSGLKGPPRVSSIRRHPMKSHMCGVGGVAWKLCARQEVASSNLIGHRTYRPFGSINCVKWFIRGPNMPCELSTLMYRTTWCNASKNFQNFYA